MKKSFKKVVSILLAISLMLSTLLFSSFVSNAAVNEQSVATINLWADPDGVISSVDEAIVTAGDKSSTVSKLGLVQAHTITSSSSDEYYLFLPSTANLASITLYFSGTLTISGRSITSGTPSDVFKLSTYSTKYSATLNGNSYSLYVVKSTGVGSVYINTDSGSMSKINSSSDHTAAEAGEIKVLESNGAVDYNGGLEKMTGHGNGTWETTNDKNSYNIKLSSSTSLLGMDKAKKWILLSGGQDKTASMIKNRLTYDFADYIGVANQSEIQPVDLYCNGHYMGSYQLVEKPEIKSNRIDIDDAYENLEIANGTIDTASGLVMPADFDTFTNLTTRSIDSSNSTVTKPTNTYGSTIGSRNYSCYDDSSYTNLTDPDDLTGGYLFGLEISDRWYEENAGFCAYSRQGWTVRSCDYISRHMIDYCYNLLYAMGSAVYQSDGNIPSTTTTTGGGYTSGLLGNTTSKTYTASNPAPSTEYQGMHWDDILDSDSAVKYYWTQEYFKNMDASTSSTYFYKDSDSVDSKIYAGPMWDMDNSIIFNTSASRYGISYTSTNGWYVKNQKIYKYLAGTDNRTTALYYNNSPYTFYAALSQQSDFWASAEDEWYKTVKPAVEILLGNSEDSGRLHSVSYYINEVKDSATMNYVRFNGYSSTYDSSYYESGITDWLSARETWIDSQIATESINDATVSTVSDQAFIGSEIKPTVSVSYNNATLGNQTLEEGVDYTISYSNNINVGTASITLTGIGRFVGTMKSITFKIVPNDITNGSLSIFDGAYIDDEITPTTLDANGIEIPSGINYTWYVDGTSAGTSPTYQVSSADAGKTITATATGDGTSVTGTLSSNSCLVYSTERPSSLQKNIATFSYKYGDDGTSLQGSKSAGYSATAGVQKDTAKIFASVGGTTSSKLEWSGSDTFTRTDGTSGQQPIMSPSSTNPWQESPYFDIDFSTTGFSNISFSADIGATKKGAKYYAIMYSTDGSNYKYLYSSDTAAEDDYIWYELSTGKVMENAFSVTLPSECNNMENVSVRIIVDDCYTLDGLDTLYTTTNTSGKIAINNVVINGEGENDITSLSAPNIVTASSSLFNDDLVTIEDDNVGSTLYYTLTDENGTVSSIYTYSKAFSPFEQMAGTEITVNAWSETGIYKSDVVSKTFTSSGDAIARFDYSSSLEDIINGKLPASGGTYGKSSVMTTVADGKSQFIPSYNTGNKAVAISPDDSVKWSANSGFYFALATSGYESITFSCDAYTTGQGPNSLSLQYSTDNSNWTTVVSNQKLSANGALENYMDRVSIPNVSNAKEIYIRLVSTENLTADGSTLHNNASKGNLYINNVVIGGTDIDSVVKMPYTNKSTNYFGASGTIKYKSPDGDAMQYVVLDSSNNIMLSGAYPVDGIFIPSATSFNPYSNEAYTVNVWAGDDDDQSVVNSSKYYYKGQTVAEFKVNSSSFSTNLSEDALSFNATTGTGFVSMYPNGTDKTALSYASSYGLKASATETNSWEYAYAGINTFESNGYWLIKTSTLGATDLTLSLEQVSSNKGPRDWGIAYSTDGENYTYLDNSNSRAIDTTSPIETYSNIELPSVLENQENVYIKVFINGGENIAGYEFKDIDNSVGKGNTGIDNITISGITAPKETTATIKATVLESKTATTGNTGLSGIEVSINGTTYTTDENGEVSFSAMEGTTYSVVVGSNGFKRQFTFNAESADKTYNIPIVSIDMNNDGYINSRDYSLILWMDDLGLKTLYKSIFVNFINVSAKEFEYEDIK